MSNKVSSMNCVFSGILLTLFICIPSTLLGDTITIGDSLLKSGIPHQYDDEWVMCSNEGVKIDGNKKEKHCGAQTWRTGKNDTPPGTNLSYWKDIIITAYNDNKTIRFTFYHQRAGWQSTAKYSINVHLLDKHFTRLKTLSMTDDYSAPDCNSPNPDDWRDKGYEESLTGNDTYKFDDIEHIVYTKKVVSHGDGWSKC